ncbi:MAG: DNA-processing protein DprA [Thermotogota bacterium]
MDTLEIITLKEVYKKSNDEIINIIERGVRPNLFEKDFENKKKMIFKILNKSKDYSILTYWDEEYPQELKNIVDPPVILYYKGSLDLFKTKKVSVVGTRKPSQYGKNICTDIVKILEDYTIVSGMAYGIDSISHRNAKKTIAVLGTGIDVIFPKTNEDLYNRITQEGLILSEYMPGTPGMKHQFPARNRIIAALSDKTIVVEAAKRSGSLITARFALDFGKDVLAVPGDVTRFNSYGTNFLIYNGATPIISLEVLKELFNINEMRMKIDNLPEKSKKIISLIKKGENTAEKISYFMNEDISNILTSLMELEIDGRIKQENGSYNLVF